MDREGQLALLNETCAFYAADISRRAIDVGGYAYCTHDGRRCAIGRLIDKPDNEVRALWGGLHIGIVSIMKEPYRYFNLEFLRVLQNLHDNHHYWDNNGLTKSGKLAYERIKTTCC